MKDLIILGTGVHAAEMVQIVERANLKKKTWNLKGLISPLDKDPRREVQGYPVMGNYKQMGTWKRALFVPSNNWPVRYAIPRERLATLVDPSAFISPTAILGKGCVVYPFCFIGHNARLGERVFCLSHSVISHDDVLGDRVTVTSGAMIAGRVQVGQDSYLGQACTIRQDISIGRDCLIGTGAVVVKDVASGSVMAGNPARKIKDKRVKPS